MDDISCESFHSLLLALQRAHEHELLMLRTQIHESGDSNPNPTGSTTFSKSGSMRWRHERRQSTASNLSASSMTAAPGETTADEFFSAKGWAFRQVARGFGQSGKAQEPEPAKNWFRRFVQGLAATQVFDTLCAVAIIGSAFFLGAALDYAGSQRTDPDDIPHAYKIIADCFSLWFVVELVIRLISTGRIFFTGPDKQWNSLDMIIVSIDLANFGASLLRELVSVPGGRSMKLLRVLRIFRMTRIIRVIRIVRFFHELRMMVISILASGKSFFFSVVLFFIILYIFGVFFTQQVLYHLSDNNYATEDTEILVKHWGTIPRGWYTLFACMTAGTAWYEVSASMLSISWTNGLMMCFFIFFSILVLGNIITGIFVDTAILSAQGDRDQVIAEEMYSHDRTVKQLKELFSEADADNSGSISLDELEMHLSNVEVTALFRSIGLQPDEVHGLFSLLDSDSSGELGIDEFVFGCMRLKGGARSIDLATLMYENKRLVSKFHDLAHGVLHGFQRIELILSTNDVQKNIGLADFCL